MRCIFSGGGTGGHIYPAITLLQTVKKLQPQTELLYVGTAKGLEADIVTKEKIPFTTLEVEGFRRSLSLHNLIVGKKAAQSLWQAGKIVRQFRPDVVVGTGGYVSGPILLAAALKGIPTLIQDQNAIPGITNKILAHFVTKIACGYASSCRHFPAAKTVLTGNPIRAAVLATKRDEAIAALGLDPRKRTILIMGGSRGARSINNAAVAVHRYFACSAKVQLLHATGAGEYESVLQQLREQGIVPHETGNLFIKPYFYEMPQALAVADLAVSRAGAIGLAELTARGIPSILVPYPYAAENHQEFNAQSLVDAQAALMILNKDLNGTRLIEAIESILSEPDRHLIMSEASRQLGRPQAAAEIAQMIIALSDKP